MKKSLRLCCLPVILALALAGCQGEDPAVDAPGETNRARPSFAADSYMAQLQKRNKIIIGVKFDAPLFGALNPATGKPEGFDVDLGSRIARELGVQPEFVEAVSVNRIPFLQQDKVDLIISTMTINEERKKQIDFSNVYYVAEQQLLVPKDSPIREAQDANARRAMVCSVKGSTSEANMRAAAPNVQMNLQEGYSQCFQLLQNGQVEAMTTDNVILVGLLKNDPQRFKITGKAFSKEPYGMGMKQGRPEFVEFVNNVLSEIKEDGTWVRLYNKWVKPVTGEDATPPPDTVAAEAPSATASPSPAASPAASPPPAAATPPGAGSAGGSQPRQQAPGPPAGTGGETPPY